MKKLLIGLASGFVLGLAALAVAQPVAQSALSGNECWNAGQGPGGPSFGWLCINPVRNSTNIVNVSGSGSATTTATGGTLAWTGTAPTTWTVTLPTVPANGTIVRLTTNTTLTTMVTVQAGGSDTLSGTFSSQTLTANTTVVGWQYSLANTTWYRIQ